MLISFLQLEGILPSLQDQNPHRLTQAKVNGWNCSFDRNWNSYKPAATAKKDSLSDLFKKLCLFFGHTFEYILVKSKCTRMESATDNSS